MFTITNNNNNNSTYVKAPIVFATNVQTIIAILRWLFL